MNHNPTLVNNSIDKSINENILPKIGRTGGIDTNQVKLVFPDNRYIFYPYHKLIQIPYFASYFNFNWLARQKTNEYKIYGNLESFQYIMNILTENHDIISKIDDDSFREIYQLADYLGLSKNLLDRQIIQKIIFLLPTHLIDRHHIQSIPDMLLNYRAQVSGKNVCLVYALDIDTTLSSSEINDYVRQISSFNLNDATTHIFNQWIERSDSEQLNWLFEYKKTPVLSNFLNTMANKYNITNDSLIGFYIFLNIGELYIRKIKQVVAIQQTIDYWKTSKNWLGGDTTLETWLMINVYIGFRVIESKSSLHFYRKFDKAKVKEDNFGHQWIDQGSCISLIDFSDIAFVFDKKN